MAMSPCADQGVCTDPEPAADIELGLSMTRDTTMSTSDRRHRRVVGEAVERGVVGVVGSAPRVVGEAVERAVVGVVGPAKPTRPSSASPRLPSLTRLSPDGRDDRVRVVSTAGELSLRELDTVDSEPGPPLFSPDGAWRWRPSIRPARGSSSPDATAR